ncbi:hydroxymethylglutaryl-CoA lyase [Vibrio wakamikoensis]|uniref:Hydroxymethylglutaryl-CoA lyase n=1 Tax=Vibrio chaetopteri TaxID=3016528 RepID=A0AAU8BS36_9VIBR
MTLPESVNIVEVGARDGLQNEPKVSLEAKVSLIDSLSQSGLRYIEAGAFVSPKRVPQMADSDRVFSNIQRRPGIIYSALTPNVRGLEAALEARADEIAVFASASESFSQNNIHCSIAESLARFEPVIALAQQHNIKVRGYLSCVADCPYEGATSPNMVADIAKAMYDLGCYQISLGDTIGSGTPLRIANMIEAVSARVSLSDLAVHFHDTYGQALANIYQALTMGIDTIDSSIAGLGGCPYAPGASGNIATEDVIYLCHGLGIDTSVDLNTLVQASSAICKALNRVPQSKITLAQILHQ